ncbi:hypothetical protein C8R44DRAFT_847552 [Mycena epipterygia]|nr:hypothetical protein C8R44DRAFT_847552 [Mycena epipterygia]
MFAKKKPSDAQDLASIQTHIRTIEKALLERPNDDVVLDLLQQTRWLISPDFISLPAPQRQLCIITVKGHASQATKKMVLGKKRSAGPSTASLATPGPEPDSNESTPPSPAAPVGGAVRSSPTASMPDTIHRSSPPSPTTFIGSPACSSPTARSQRSRPALTARSAVSSYRSTSTAESFGTAQESLE